MKNIVLQKYGISDFKKKKNYRPIPRLYQGLNKISYTTESADSNRVYSLNDIACVNVKDLWFCSTLLVTNIH